MALQHGRQALCAIDAMDHPGSAGFELVQQNSISSSGYVCRETYDRYESCDSTHLARQSSSVPSESMTLGVEESSTILSWCPTGVPESPRSCSSVVLEGIYNNSPYFSKRACLANDNGISLLEKMNDLRLDSVAVGCGVSGDLSVGKDVRISSPEGLDEQVLYRQGC